MRDTIDERLTQLGESLEAAAEARTPMLVRSRGEQIRVAHRRRVAAVTAVSAAVAVIGIGSLVAFRPAGGHQVTPVTPGTSGHSSAPPAPSTSGTTATTATSTTPIAVVDLKQDTMTVYDHHGQVLKTIPVTGGTAKYPSHVGDLTVTGKQDSLKLQSTVNGDYYDRTVDWVITLSGGQQLDAAPWAEASLGKQNTTHGEIGLSPDSAKWLYDHVAVGDRIRVQ